MGSSGLQARLKKAPPGSIRTGGFHGKLGRMGIKESSPWAADLHRCLQK